MHTVWLVVHPVFLLYCIHLLGYCIYWLYICVCICYIFIVFGLWWYIFTSESKVWLEAHRNGLGWGLKSFNGSWINLLASVWTAGVMLIFKKGRTCVKGPGGWWQPSLCKGSRRQYQTFMEENDCLSTDQSRLQMLMLHHLLGPKL